MERVINRDRSWSSPRRRPYRPARCPNPLRGTEAERFRTGLERSLHQVARQVVERLEFFPGQVRPVKLGRIAFALSRLLAHDYPLLSTGDSDPHQRIESATRVQREEISCNMS